MSCALNTVTAYLGKGKSTTTAERYQWNYGQVLRIDGINLPHSFQTHFSNQPRVGTAKTFIGTDGAVEIPDEYIITGKTIYAWIFLHESETDGETVYSITIPVIPRPQPVDEEPTPVQQSEINQLVAALNSGVERAETAADSAEASATAATEAAEQTSADATITAQKAAEASQAAQVALSASQAASEAAVNASESEVNAGQSAAEAAESADRAEQAAATAGYMYFYIDENGDLIYQRTPNTQADFYLEDGDLYVRATA